MYHRRRTEPELIWHRTIESILMGDYLCLNQHIPTPYKKKILQVKKMDKYLCSDMFQ